MKNRSHKEYQVINLTMEYGGAISGFKYAIASYLPEKELRMRYKKELIKYEPFLYLTGEQGAAIRESVKNEEKYKKRHLLMEDAFGYMDGVMETHHKDVRALRSVELTEEVRDPLDILVGREEYEEEQKILEKRLAALEKAMEGLTERQLRRMRMAYLEELTEAEISRQEKVDVSVVHRSIKGAENNLRKKLKKA